MTARALVLLSSFGLIACFDERPDVLPEAERGAEGAAEPADPEPADPRPEPADPSPEPAEPSPEPADPSPEPEPIARAWARGQRDATVTSFDGTPIALTLFTPELAAGASAPLVLHSHGWGGSRLTDLGAPGLLGRAPEQAAALARDAGYFVLSFDQRGFGESGGDAMVMSPAFEGRDLQAVIDWAEVELGDSLARDGDPLIGSLGLSYGGGYQLVGAAVDARVDAIIPTATWHYLPYSLAPNGVPKNDWIDVLMLLGVTGAQGTLDPLIYEAFVQSLVARVSDETLGSLAPNGLHDFCAGIDPRGIPKVDAFLVQGLSDTLFNVNEAAMNARCLASAGNDVRLLVQRFGHILPVLQDGEGTIGFDVDEHVRCGATGFDVAPAMVSFLDEKLRDHAPAIAIPRVCVVQDDDHGVVLDELPLGGAPFAVDTVITSPVLVELVLEVLRERPLVEVLELLVAVPPDLLRTLTLVLTGLKSPSALEGSALALADALPADLLNEALSASRWLPLYTSPGDEDLVGIPTIDVSVTATTGHEPLAFVGVGVQRAGSAVTELLHDQVWPLRGAGDYHQDLVAVSARLGPGDRVGLLVFGYHPQYLNAPTLNPGALRLRGHVALPLVAN